MFTKTSIAVAMIVVVASAAGAAEKRQVAAEKPHVAASAYAQGSQLGPITLPSTTPEGNRQGWFAD